MEFLLQQRVAGGDGVARAFGRDTSFVETLEVRVNVRRSEGCGAQFCVRPHGGREFKV